MKGTSKHIIEAKLNPPIIENNILRRNELIKKVASNEKAKLIIITAPGGYGKTVLAYQIVKSEDNPYIWYHLDESDNDPVVFLNYIFSGFLKYASKRTDSFEEEVSIVLKGIENGKDNVYGTAAFLIEKIQKIQYKQIYLVLDDFHMIKDKYIIDFLNIFILYASEKLHIIITSRKYPEIDISKLRQQGTIVEIEKDSMKFSYDEFISMINKEKNPDEYNQNIIQTIYAKSEGWPLALDIFYKKFKSNYNELKKNIDFIQSGEAFFNYFLFQVYNSLPEYLKEFLLDISVLDKITPDACSYLSNNPDANNILKYLVINNVFINKISNLNQVYTCHQLFKEFLQSQLGNKIRGYYLKAGEFYKSQKNYGEAIEYFIKAKDVEMALKMFSYTGVDAVRNGRLKTAERWIDFFNSCNLSENRWIILTNALISLYKGMFNISEKYLSQIIKDFYQDEDKYGYCVALIVKARILLYRYSFDKCIETADIVIRMSDEVEEFTLYEAFMQKAYGQILKGDFDDSVITLELGAEILNRRGAERLAFYVQRYLVLPYFLKFEYHKAVSYYELTCNMSDEEINLTERFSIDLYLARIYRDMGRLSEAKSIMENTIRRKKALGYVEDIFAVYYHLATLYRDLKDYEAALKYVALSEELFKSGGSTMEFKYLAKALKALILSDTGDIEEAKKLIEEALHELAIGNSKFMVEVAYHSAGLIYIRANEYKKAVKCLETGYEMAAKTGLKSMIVVCGGILVGIYINDNKVKGESYAAKSLTLAAGQNYIQAYLTNPEMDKCIAVGFANGIEKDFVIQIINNLEEERVKQILKWLILNSSIDKVNEFLKIIKTKIIISRDIFSEIVTTFLAAENGSIEELIAKLKPAIQKQDNSLPKLVVCCFGSFKVYNAISDDVRIKWRTNKAKELLAYFIHNCGKEIMTEKLLVDIWPDYSLEKARELFYTNMALVRNVLNKCELKDNLIKIQSGYVFNKQDIYCDEWVVCQNTSDVSNLLKKGYLDDIYSDWAFEARNEYEILLKK